jgi:peroxiredoxin
VWPEIKAFGATLIAISPQLERYSRDVIAQHKLSFDLLSDKGRGCRLRASLHTTPGTWSASKRFRHRFPGTPWRRFMDATCARAIRRFVVDQSGIIRSAEADPDYTVRPHGRSAQGNKRLLKSATAFSRLGSCALQLSCRNTFPSSIRPGRSARRCRAFIALSFTSGVARRKPSA